MTPPTLAGIPSPALARRASATTVARSSTHTRAAPSGHAVRTSTLPATPHPPTLRARIRTRLTFDHLGERAVTLAYESHGTSPSAETHAGTATVQPVTPTLVLGGISAGCHLGPASFDPAPGWWPGLVGRGLALDPARRPLIGVDYLGGADDSPLRPVTTHDQARAVAAVLDHLDMARASFVGASYGGMVALAFAELYPERTARLVVICAAHRNHPMATALRSVQRAAVELGVEAGHPGRGLALARSLAMTTYRSTREFEERFSPFALSAGTPGGDPARFPVQDYIEARGADFVRRFDTERFLALSESIDLHSTGPCSLPEHALLVSFDTDTLVPPWLMEELARRGAGAEPGRPRARHVTIPSPYGHDAFLKEVGPVGDVLKAALGSEETGPAGSAPTLSQLHQEEAVR